MENITYIIHFKVLSKVNEIQYLTWLQELFATMITVRCVDSAYKHRANYDNAAQIKF